MVIKLKNQFYSLIKSLGYNITDNGNYIESFPWLMLRLTNDEFSRSYDTINHKVVLTLDIFSTYAGEKEILEIVKNITNSLWDFQQSHSEILYANQKMFKILDDKLTGPVKKHGVVNYEFYLGQGLIQEEGLENDEAH